MELKDTIDGMLSDDWKDRLKAEYNQLRIRTAKLSQYINKLKQEEIQEHYNGELFQCTIQYLSMKDYLNAIENRMKSLDIILR